MKPIHPSRFGKDHWSTLAYIECCCVDHEGRLDKRRLRANSKTHPLHAVNGLAWQGAWGTRLKGGKVVKSHDDYDCIHDLETAGYIKVVSEVNAFVKLTPAGRAMAALLRAHKAAGGQFATFAPLESESNSRLCLG